MRDGLGAMRRERPLDALPAPLMVLQIVQGFSGIGHCIGGVQVI